jgi:hypothetical protein
MWNRAGPIVLMVQVLALMTRSVTCNLLRAARQRERRVLATRASVAAEEQVNQENQCFAV